VISIYPITTGLIKAGDDPMKRIVDSIWVDIEEGDVLVISSKPLLTAYGKVVDLSFIRYGRNALELSKRYSIGPKFAELILKYPDGIYRGVREAILTVVDDVLLANAGLDRKNAGINKVALPFTELKGIVGKFYKYVYDKYGVRVGVIISDSMIAPLRGGLEP